MTRRLLEGATAASGEYSGAEWGWRASGFWASVSSANPHINDPQCGDHMGRQDKDKIGKDHPMCYSMHSFPVASPSPTSS